MGSMEISEDGLSDDEKDIMINEITGQKACKGKSNKMSTSETYEEEKGMMFWKTRGWINLVSVCVCGLVNLGLYFTIKKELVSKDFGSIEF
jgi:hypothetical protein